MGYTTFTGPIRAGNILDTTGTLPGNDVANVGQVVMSQVFAVEEDTQVITTVSLPAYSQVLTMEFRVVIPFTNSISVGNTTDGTTVNATYFSNAVALASAGRVSVSTTTSTQNDNWINVGYPDSQVVLVGGAAAGPGRGVYTVTYIQGPNGNT